MKSIHRLTHTFKWLLILFSLNTHALIGQEFDFLRVINRYPILDQTGLSYEKPFIGGLNRPIQQFVDIDGDNDLDMFVKDRANQLLFFRNIGTTTSSQFEWITDQFEGLDVGAWFKFADPDSDGDLDLFAETALGIIGYYRNTGSPSNPNFVIASDTLNDNTGSPIFVDGFSIPEWADIDCDADLDLFLGRQTGRVTLYEQIGLDSGNLPLYEFVTDTFQGIFIVTGGGIQASKPIQGNYSKRHGANSLTFVDIDDDQDLDLFWGDFFAESLISLENLGTCENPIFDMQAIIEAYPPGNPISTGGFNIPRFPDIDADGDLDLFVGVQGGWISLSRNLSSNFHFYKNIGTSQQPSFALQTDKFIAGIDIGSSSIPAFVDIDADGDLDLFLANEADPVSPQSSRLHFFENQGSNTSPFYRLVDIHFLSLEIGFNYAPTFVDFDSDGDVDLFLGEWAGNINYLRNEGSPQSPSFVVLDQDFGGIDVGNNNTPAFIDIDDDQDLDLFIGEFTGNLNFYENIGTQAAPNFELNTSQYFGIDVGEFSYPTFVDLDHDGDADLLIGSDAQGISLYRNTGSPQSANFVLDESFQIPLHLRTSPNFVDIDDDGDEDLFSGSDGGGLIFYENQNIVVSMRPPQTNPLLPGMVRLWQNHPNPFNPTTVIEFQIPDSRFVSLRVFDILGREVTALVNAEKQAGRYSVNFNGASLSTGIYYYRLEAGVYTETKQMFLLK